MALRGQENPTQDLLDFRYREKFHLSQQQLENEPQDIYNLNLSIISKENELHHEEAEHQAAAQERDNRTG